MPPVIDLSRYDLEPAQPVALLPDFLRRAGDLMSAAAIYINGDYPPGAIEWLKLNRPDISSELGLKSAQVDAAFGAGDFAGFREAVDAWRRYHLRAWRVFREAQ
jgi:hypothetical protein